MIEKPTTPPPNGVAAEFGYYPMVCNIKTRRFILKTLPDHKEIVADVRGHQNVVKGWIYPAAQQVLKGGNREMPYSARTFGLPKTHVLTLRKSESQEELVFVVWCLSFLTGMRLTTTDRGFLDATPILPGKLIDFSLSRCTLTDALNLALDYLESERSNPRALRRVEAVIHTLFLAQHPQSLDFEKFQYLYMALDACFKLVISKEPNISKPTGLEKSHAGRIQWMCHKFGLPVPGWATLDAQSKTELSIVRNDLSHEALFFDQPIGFAIYSGRHIKGKNINVPLQMQALICRILVAILGRPGVGYVKTPIDTRQRFALELRPTRLKNRWTVRNNFEARLRISASQG